MNVRLTQIDGALPNIALMRLAAWHRDRGDNVVYTRSIEPQYLDPPFDFVDGYDVVYGSAIFSFSAERISRFFAAWPAAIVGGTGTGQTRTTESITGDYDGPLDYSGFPDFVESIGFTQRGCRLSCKFCVVPKKEGKPRSVASIFDIWRGSPYPKKIHLLDNDFFGQPREEWTARIREIREGGFRVCLSQGINVRLINDETAAALASIQYRDTKFKVRRLYTAWDNLGDEKVFFRGVDTLERAGVPARHLMAYMLVGFDPKETFDRVMYRFERMVERGIRPYPMVYDRRRKDLCAFQRWAITGLHRAVPWSDYRDPRKAA